jgi:hypothetical protein
MIRRSRIGRNHGDADLAAGCDFLASRPTGSAASSKSGHTDHGLRIMPIQKAVADVFN